VNGVINIMSKDAKDTQGLYAEGGGGSVLRDFGGARYGGVLASNIFFRVYGKYFNRSDEVFSNAMDASDSWRMGQGGFRIDDEASDQNHFTLQGDLYSGVENVNTGGSAVVNGGNVLGRWSHTFSESSDMSLQLYYDRTHLADPIPAYIVGPFQLAPAGVLTDDLDTYDLDFQHHFRLGGWNNIIWGLGYRFTREVDDNAPALALIPSALDRNLYSGFVQDEIELRDNLFFTLGTKLEHNDYTGFEVEPSARLKWDVTSKQMVWAAVSRAVRTPSRIDVDLTQPGPGSLLTILQGGGAGYKSENVIAYELGYRAQLGPKLDASVSTFYNVYNDLRSVTTNSTLDAFGLPFPYYFQNNLEGHTYGVEFGVNFQVFDGWRLHAGYDFLKESLHVKPGQNDINNGLNETSDPEHQFQIRSSIDLPGRLELDTGLRWVDILRVNNGPAEATVPSYFELDVRLGWHATKNLEFSVVGQNLLHDHHAEAGYPGSPTAEQIVRNIYGEVTFRW